MDSERFDAITMRLAKELRPRRGVLRLAAGAALAGVLGGRVAEAAPACVKDGKACDPAKSGGRCCSGTCAKKGKHHRCKPAPDALGCTVRDDVCAGLRPAACPGDPAGFCVVLDNGKPYCGGEAACFACATGADCDRQYNITGGQCVTRCAACPQTEGKMCVVPLK